MPVCRLTRNAASFRGVFVLSAWRLIGSSCVAVAPARSYEQQREEEGRMSSRSLDVVVRYCLRRRRVGVRARDASKRVSLAQPTARSSRAPHSRWPNAGDD